ncbi:hypothetical protein D910_08571 [Dendroctonus ponderosae]|uniref:Uncharacterized protein n=1 Tax=Dendroctonus ponderosae TaxID=77166 RepID=U4UMI7_DENPD|nr:hypothetical protein D910_08571 [Dendroctonus ponderosae]
MAFGRNNVFRNRNSWGPVSSCGTVGLPRPDPEEEHTERMATAQMRQLDPLKEDLADWLNKTLATHDHDRRHGRATQEEESD